MVQGIRGARAAARLVELLESARPLPLFRGQVRVRKLEVYELLAALRDESSTPRPDEAVRPLLDVAEAVERAVYHAPALPLSEDVRLPRERVAELAQALRSAVKGA